MTREEVDRAQYEWHDLYDDRQQRLLTKQAAEELLGRGALEKGEHITERVYQRDDGTQLSIQFIPAHVEEHEHGEMSFGDRWEIFQTRKKVVQ